jgi:hypothetical protein
MVHTEGKSLEGKEREKYMQQKKGKKFMRQKIRDC